jgi:hypothetical protein
MRKTKTYMLSAAALGGLFLIGSLMHSRDSQAKGATYATPVTVTNSTANAAGVRDEDSPGRNAFQASLNLSLSGVSGQGLSIPAGKRLVVDFVTFAGSGPSAGTQPYLEIFTTQGAGPSVGYQFRPSQSPLALQQFDLAQPVNIYGDNVFVSLAFAGNAPPFLSAGVSISGHLIDMP